MILVHVYPEVLGRAIGEEGFEQLASVINFCVCGGKSVEKCRISVARRCYIKYYLYTLFLRKLSAHNSSYHCLYKSKQRQLFRVHPGTRRCLLHQLFAVNIGLYHRVYRVLYVRSSWTIRQVITGKEDFLFLDWQLYIACSFADTEDYCYILPCLII